MKLHLGLRTPQITAQQNTQVNTQTRTQIATQVTLRSDLYLSPLSAHAKGLDSAAVPTLDSLVVHPTYCSPCSDITASRHNSHGKGNRSTGGIWCMLSHCEPFSILPRSELFVLTDDMMYLHARSDHHMGQIRKEGQSPTREHGYGYGQMICVSASASAQPAPASLQ